MGIGHFDNAVQKITSRQQTAANNPARPAFSAPEPLVALVLLPYIPRETFYLLFVLIHDVDTQLLVILHR
ncbi:hypothetical protein D3OALGB2SA_1759 [Olavius algarvensis associated proteobacterium Delta 3]|nr:hypothetical protein D3OALGB2SA_1759 [Olavius algarvensis associated proteobacterium Delta 3]